jgi:inorganic triphosphatase YgiF
MAVAEPREFELKYQSHDPAVVERLRSVEQIAPKYALHTKGVVLHTDTYYDSADFRLMRCGLTLRVRNGGANPVVTVKSLDLHNGEVLHDRLEIEREIGVLGEPPSSGVWPPDITRQIAATTGDDAELIPIVTLVQNRLKRRVVWSERKKSRSAKHNHTTVAELSIDDVTVQRGPIQGAVEPDCVLPAVVRFQEIEIEAAEDQNPEHLHKLAGIMAGFAGLEAVAGSKFARGLAAVSMYAPGAPENTVGVLPEMHMAEACRLIWRTQLTALLLNEYGARADIDPTYVHDMRVAIRRARVAADVFGDYFRRGRIRPYLRMLKELGRRLGPCVIWMSPCKISPSQKRRLHYESARAWRRLARSGSGDARLPTTN